MVLKSHYPDVEIEDKPTYTLLLEACDKFTDKIAVVLVCVICVIYVKLKFRSMATADINIRTSLICHCVWRRQFMREMFKKATSSQSRCRIVLNILLHLSAFPDEVLFVHY